MAARRETKSERFRRNLPGDPAPAAPLAGALLRFAWQKVQDRRLDALSRAGFTDLNEAHLKVLRFPPPDADRPSVLAQRSGMTKQALNYLLVQLEELGYVRRHRSRGHGARLVSLTERGWQVARLQRATVRAVEREWSSQIGEPRFAVFMEVLREIATAK